MNEPTERCDCRCHSNHVAGCDHEHDRGSSGVEGVPSCSPCNGVKGCDYCGRTDGKHEWVEGDCVLRHRRHSRKLISGGQVCVPCTERWADWLRDVIELYAGLSRVVPAGSVPVPEDDEYHAPRKRIGSPSPLRLDAWAMLHGKINHRWRERDADGVDHWRSGWLEKGVLPDVPALLAAWAEALWTAQGWGNDWPATVSGAATALTTHTEVIARLPDVDTFDAELRWIRSTLQTVHGIADPKPLGACLSIDCTGRVWPDPEHAGPAKCDRCQRRYGHLDLVRLKITEEGQAAS